MQQLLAAWAKSLAAQNPVVVDHLACACVNSVLHARQHVVQRCQPSRRRQQRRPRYFQLPREARVACRHAGPGPGSPLQADRRQTLQESTNCSVERTYSSFRRKP